MPTAAVLRRSGGNAQRVVVVDVGDGLMRAYKSKIVESDGVPVRNRGCLSLPGKSGVTVRPKTVKVRRKTERENGAFIKGEDLKARAFCHEMNHLDGHLYIERLAPRSS